MSRLEIMMMTALFKSDFISLTASTREAYLGSSRNQSGACLCDMRIMVSECFGTPTSQSGGMVVKAALGNGNTACVRKA